jgi:hypothetical protein
MSPLQHCNICVVQVYQTCFSDAFCALLDLPPGNSHPLVYVYCLEEVLLANGQLTDVLMPAHQVKMDSSVPWDILNVDIFKTTPGNTGNEQASNLQLQKPEVGRLQGCSCRRTGLTFNSVNFPAAVCALEMQQLPSVTELFANDHLMPASMRDLKALVCDPYDEFKNNDDGDNGFK